MDDPIPGVLDKRGLYVDSKRTEIMQAILGFVLIFLGLFGISTGANDWVIFTCGVAGATMYAGAIASRAMRVRTIRHYETDHPGDPLPRRPWSLTNRR